MADTLGVVFSITVFLWIPTLCWMIFLFIRFINKKKNRPITEKKRNINANLVIASFIFLILGGINFTALRLTGALFKFNVSPKLMQSLREVFNIIGSFCQVVVFVLILYIFTFRLRTAFKGTQFDYNRWFYIVICTIFIIVGFITLIGGILSDIEGGYIIIGAGIILYILNCIFLTYLFIHSLKKVQGQQRSISKDIALIDLMTKFTGLVLLSLPTTIIFCITAIVGGFSEPIEIINIIIRPFDFGINTLCIYLQFSFTKDDYAQYMDKYHNFVRYLLVRKTKDEINVAESIQIESVKSKSDLSSESPTPL